VIKKHGRQEVNFACQSTNSLHAGVDKSERAFVRVRILKQKVSKKTRRRYMRNRGGQKRIKKGRL
jgi:hypothetical protein